MDPDSFAIEPCTPKTERTIALLNEDVFGPGRFVRTAYRIREGAAGDERLNLCGRIGMQVIGAIHFTPILIGDQGGGLLLGPLVIAKNRSNRGYGLRLMLAGLARSRDLGYRLVILAGDLPYYARAGFAAVPAGQIIMPGPVDPARLLYAALIHGALGTYHGLIRGQPAESAGGAVTNVLPDTRSQPGGEAPGQAPGSRL